MFLLIFAFFISFAICAPLTVSVHGSAEAPLRVMVVCGLHPREVVSPALCARWAALLAETPPARVRFVLATVQHSFPADPCWRGNARGVDLNRNWPHIPMSTASSVQLLNAAAAPAGEAETQALDAALREHAPDILLAVHSGTNAVLTPYDSCDATPANWPDLLRLGRWLVAGGVCPQCSVDAAPRHLQYEASGTLTDYALHVLGVPLVLTLEVYENATAVAALVRSKDAPLDAALCRALFVPPSMERVLAPWDEALRRLAQPSDDDYVELCRMAGVLT